MGQLAPMANVAMYLASAMTADDVLQAGTPHVVLATGSRWRADAVGRTHRMPVAGLDAGPVLTPDHFLQGGGVDALASPAVIFDDDGYYMGAILAELLARAGHSTVYVTPHAEVSRWTHHTMEQPRIQARLIELGVAIHPHRAGGPQRRRAGTRLHLHRRRETIHCGTLVPVTSRLPEEALWLELRAPGRMGRRRHPLGDPDRRLPGAGNHCRGGALRPSLRPRVRRNHRSRRRAVQARGHVV
jgi:dimethylamine/trimethylamine dehydrogenase